MILPTYLLGRYSLDSPFHLKKGRKFWVTQLLVIRVQSHLPVREIYSPTSTAELWISINGTLVYHQYSWILEVSDFFFVLVMGGPRNGQPVFSLWLYVKRPNSHLDVRLVGWKRPQVGTHLWVTRRRSSPKAVGRKRLWSQSDALPQKTPPQRQLPCQAMVLNVRRQMRTQRKKYSCSVLVCFHGGR